VFSFFPPSEPELLERAHRVAARVMLDWPGHAAYVGGSLLAGLGTPNSDVDLFVLVDQPRATEQVPVDGLRCDIEFVTPESLAALIDACGVFAVSETNLSQLAIAKPPALDRLVRLIYGATVADDDSGTVGRLRVRANARSEAIQLLIVAGQSMNCANRVEDAFGSLAVGDEVGAQYLARQSLIAAADALLVTRGDGYRGEKWMWRRWDRTVGAALGAGVTDLLREPAVAVRPAFWLCQDLLVHAMTDRSYPILTDGPETGALRDPSVIPVLTNGPILLNKDDHSVRVSRQGAFLWGAAHGRTRDAAVKIVAGQLEAAEPDVQKYYDSLLESGVLREEL